MALDEALADAGKAIDLALNIAVPDEELVRRLERPLDLPQLRRHLPRGQQPAAGRRAAATTAAASSTSVTTTKPETVRARLEKQKPPADMLALLPRRRASWSTSTATQSVERGDGSDLLEAIEARANGTRSR